jgi:hypothetical protein
MKITIEKAVLEHVRAWIAERPEDRTESAGKIVAMLTRALAQPAAQQTEPAGEPVAARVVRRILPDEDETPAASTYDVQWIGVDPFKFAGDLFTRPAVPLTDEHMCEAMRKAADDLRDHIYEFGTISEGVNPRLLAVGRAVEAAHKIGGAE